MKTRHVRRLREQIERDRCPEAVNRITHKWSEFGIPDPYSFGFVTGWECLRCGKMEWS